MNLEPRSKHELLEYLIRSDGKVICKLCGEILASRTHWYRHKYKLHLPYSSQPSPLYQCEQCNAFFKSRKGYIGHSHRHTETELPQVIIKQEPIDNEVGIPTEMYREQKQTLTKFVRSNSQNDFLEDKTIDWDDQREKEERLVSQIIDRVRRECEEQGTKINRRGYSRRSTIMNT